MLLGIILIGAFFVRLYRFNNPIADWHSWRQVDTSSVSRNFVTHGFDVLRPRFDDISNVPSGLDNPQGYRFVEFPIFNVFQAGMFRLFDFFTLEEWGRLVTIFSSLLSIGFLFLLVRKYADSITALFSAFFFAFIPYNIFYGRTILPDPMMTMATLGGIYFFDLWIGESSKFKVQSSKSSHKGTSTARALSTSWGRFFKASQFKIKNLLLFAIAAIFTASALLLKPFAAFFLLPMVIIVWNAYGFNFLKKWELWVFLILSVLPLVGWRTWILQYPEGIPVNNWLFNGNGIRFRPSFFRWIGYERVSKLILGYFGMPIVLIGLFTVLKRKKKELFFLSFAVASILYVCVVATGNVQHDYYQIPLIPTIAIFMGFGAAFLVHPSKKIINKYVAYAILASCTVLGFIFSWYLVRDYFNINNSAIVEAGKTVDKNTPQDAKVIALYDGDTTFLYQTNRRGWASLEKPLPEMIKMGARYMAIVNPTPNDLSGFGKEFEVVASSPQYLILKLK